MPNPFAQLRLQNIFGAPPDYSGYGDTDNSKLMSGDFQIGPHMGGPFRQAQFRPLSPTQPDQINPNSYDSSPDAYDPDARMKELYHPDTHGIEHMNQLMNEYPADHPSKWDTARGIIAGLAFGPQQGQRVANQRSDEALADWKNKVSVAQQAANLERYQNTNDRTIAYNTVQAELKNNSEQRKASNADAKIKISDFKAHHPNMTFTKVKGGNIQAQDPLTGKLFDTGISSGTLTDADLIEAKGAAADDLAQVKGGEARATAAAGEGNKERFAQQVGAWSPPYNTPDGRTISVNTATGESREYNGVSGLSKPGTKTGTGAGLPPTQLKVQQYLRAKKLVAMHPELAPYVKFDTAGSNTFETTTPDDPDTANTLNNGIYGEDIPLGQPGRSNKQPIGPNNPPGDLGPQRPMPSHSAPPSDPTKLLSSGRQLLDVYDQNGKLVGHIHNTQGQIAAAGSNGYTVR